MIEPNRQGEVWVFAEQEDGTLNDVSLELCGKAAELAGRLKVKTGAVLPGHRVEDMAKRLIAFGIDTVYATDDPRLAHFQTNSYARVLSTLVEKHRPQIVLYGATALGRDLAPRVASTIQAGMTADCTDLDISDVADPKTKETHANLLLQIRPAFGGNIIATIVNYDRWPQMATVREGVMPLLEPDFTRTGRIVCEPVELDETVLALKLIERHIEPRKVNLKGARVIVAGGGGIGSKENFKLIYDLAGVIGGAVAPAAPRSTAATSARNTRWGRPAPPSGRPCTSPWPSAARSSTAPAWKNRPRSSPSTSIATRRSSPSRTTASWATTRLCCR